MTTSTTRPVQQTTVDRPITLGLPLDDPEPPADCGVCAALAVQRTDARGRGDLSKVSDLNVEIRNHHQPRPKRRR
ncbi:hypothetical protein SCAB_48031 [Streptomyces scabiei 87.22]|uniref:Uncharacterized protein n=1 Tax=Streptomyces scabiei (strain 87.22) TaxID=680198 RepID=C9ZDT0_STRSW|nr:MULTISPECIES: hypothetical protein [Streptomyces]MDX2626462.1 hypothetical protein [Streptomyces scabiei]MDX2892518.1 hypothetical protein [Streptomyces scabiei]MDX2900611.1 hypothetical protein [Streptomyces scabiei]MDX2994143.1 hypothetical protein [Streptomyces scabiei]MDX3028614.1 hypothetical protein [Streptomyces scabiei]